MVDSSETDSLSSNLRQATAAALADVEALGITSEDRNVVLKALLQARFGEFTATSPDHKVSGGLATPAGNQIGAPKVSENGDALDKISTILKLDRDTLELVYAIQDGEPRVVVSAKKIATNRSLATRQLGQLVATARQIAGIEEWTSSGVIRSVVQNYGRLDTSNFAANIQQMDDVAVIRGKGQQREVKITKPGVEATTALIKAIIGSDS